MNINSRLKYDKYFFGILLRYNLEMYNYSDLKEMKMNRLNIFDYVRIFSLYLSCHQNSQMKAAVIQIKCSTSLM